MDPNRVSLLNLGKERLAFTSARQQVLAKNIANADTPGAKAYDLKSPRFGDVMKGRGVPAVSLSATHPAHLGQGGAAGSSGVRPTQIAPYETSLSGNQINIEQQLVLSTQNSVDHQAASSVYTKTMSMFRTALGRSGM